MYVTTYMALILAHWEVFGIGSNEHNKNYITNDDVGLQGNARRAVFKYGYACV